MSDLGEAMRAAVPDPPPAPARAEGARLRARRTRRRKIGAAVAVALVAVAIPVGWSLSNDPVEPATTVPDLSDFACPAILREPTHDASGSELPDGVVAVRLCQGPGLFEIGAPDDFLTIGGDELAEIVNDAEVDTGEQVCPLDDGPDYTMAFGYRDGSVRVVVGELSGCRFVRVGNSTRPIAQELLGAFVDLLRVQRIASTPPPGEAAPRCPGIPSEEALLGEPREITRAVLCVAPFTSGVTPTYTPVSVPAGDLEVLLDDLTDPVQRPGTGQRCGTEYLALAGRTRWNDLVTIPWISCRDVGPVSRDIIAKLIERSGV